MKSAKLPDKLAVKDGLAVCPVCRGKTNQVIRPETKAENLQLWCPRCKRAFIVNIAFGQCCLIDQCC